MKKSELKSLYRSTGVTLMLLLATIYLSLYGLLPILVYELDTPAKIISFIAALSAGYLINKGFITKRKVNSFDIVAAVIIIFGTITTIEIIWGIREYSDLLLWVIIPFAIGIISPLHWPSIGKGFYYLFDLDTIFESEDKDEDKAIKEKRANIKAQIAHLKSAPSESFIDLFGTFDDAELCNRKNFVGHITASGTIIHTESQEVLLLHHKFLNAWHVPGGHVDPEDKSTLAAALREVKEETGIIASQLTPLNIIDGVQYCVEINSHPIPRNEKRSEDAHYHHDFRYLFAYSGDKDIHIDNNESRNYKWVSIEDEYLKKLFDTEELKKIITSE